MNLRRLLSPCQVLQHGALLACIPFMVLLTGCETFSPITRAQAIVLMNDRLRADNRRQGIAVLATRYDEGRRPPYPFIYQSIAQKDPDPVVRAMAIRALNICRDQSATKIFIAGLQDDNEQIRLESVKALVNLPDPDAIPRLLQILSGSRLLLTSTGERADIAESSDLRIAAADALHSYRDKVDVKRTLVQYLNNSDFAIAWQCHQSLISLTGRDLKYDEGAWLKYLVDAKG